MLTPIRRGEGGEGQRGEYALRHLLVSEWQLEVLSQAAAEGLRFCSHGNTHDGDVRRT